MRKSVERDLIFDIGMSEGNDTEFYLRKGFRVVGVEADPVAAAAIEKRFADDIESGSLRVFNRAAHDTSGDLLQFFVNQRQQGHSRMLSAHAAGRVGQVVMVSTICWRDLAGIAGVPYYCKVDIEGAEVPFISSISGSLERPTYISAECHTRAPLEALHSLGYPCFRLINQNILHTFKAPYPPLELGYLPDHKFKNASGFFGLELPGNRWLDFDEAMACYDAIQNLRELETIIGSVWFDCHAWLGP